MPIRFSCPSCSRRLVIENRRAGRKSKCPACGGTVTIPEEALSHTHAVTSTPRPVTFCSIEEGTGSTGSAVSDAGTVRDAEQKPSPPGKPLFFGLPPIAVLVSSGAVLFAAILLATVLIVLRQGHKESSPVADESQRNTAEEQAERWTRDEKENLAHFFRALKFYDMALESTEEWNKRVPERRKKKPMLETDVQARVAGFEAALHEARAAKGEVLAKAHPKLPDIFSKFIRSWELWVRLLKGEDDKEERESLNEQWLEWWFVNESKVRFPDKLPVYFGEEFSQWRQQDWNGRVPEFIPELRQQGSMQNPIWTREEKQNFAHFYRSRRAFDEAAEIINDQGKSKKGADKSQMKFDLTVVLRAALGEANAVREELLAKAHPELPSAFKDTYIRHLDGMIRYYEFDNFDRETLALLARWVDWWNANKKDVRVPIDVPY